jgi:hypothetical protein
MILIDKTSYTSEPYDSESEFEESVWNLRINLFGINRIYFNFKKKIGSLGKTRNIPDGYLIDFSSSVTPKLFVVENELAIHGLKHIAIQVLEFSISYDSSKQKIKTFLRDAITRNPEILNQVEKYILDNGFQNIDYLLDKTLDIQKKSDINVIVVIDQVDEDLESALLEKFKFPIEILTLERYKNNLGEYCYSFEPFLKDLIPISNSVNMVNTSFDSDLIDTIVVPAQEDGVQETFFGEKRWYQIQINATMISQIKYLAIYQVAPISAITYFAEVDSIEPWQNGSKYVVNFKSEPQKIGPVKLISKGKVKALQNIRYTSLTKLKKAKNLDDAF